MDRLLNRGGSGSRIPTTTISITPSTFCCTRNRFVLLRNKFVSVYQQVFIGIDGATMKRGLCPMELMQPIPRDLKDNGVAAMLVYHITIEAAMTSLEYCL